jgi:steroid 5-alpha reductase family enzyme
MFDQISITLPTTAFAIFLFMNLWFVIALVRKRVDIIDIGWGSGFFLVALVCLGAGPAVTPRMLAVVLLVFLWGIRLSLHIGLRQRNRKPDFRSQPMSERRGRHPGLSMYLMFMLQGLVIFLVSLPMIVVSASPSMTFGALDWLGVVLWITGFLFEAVADIQLVMFRRNPANRGNLLRTGLWRYSRHPNYFGEVVQWWGIFVIALSVPYRLLSLIGPLTITFFILKISGIPLMERHLAANSDFEAYRRRTSGFIPWFPKKKANLP